MILAGDIGGTKCNLGLFQPEGLALRSVFQRRLATRDYTGFEDLIGDFLKQAAAETDENASGPPIRAAGFAVAGAVVEGQRYSANLPWVLDVLALSRKLNLSNIQLLNDLIATALSLERLSANDFVMLNRGVPGHHATKGVIAAGTGLGEALLFWDGEKYRVAPAEGGQADFAPRTERQTQLLSHLRLQLGDVLVRRDCLRAGISQDSRISEPGGASRIVRVARGQCRGRNHAAGLGKILRRLRGDTGFLD